MSNSLILNWNEIHALALAMRVYVIGKSVNRVYIRARPHPGFSKNEWVLSFENGFHLTLRAVSNESVFTLTKSPPEKAKSPAWSSFGTKIKQTLEGAKLTELKGLQGDRLLMLEFQKHNERYSLLFSMIPTKPELFLLSGPLPETLDPNLKVLHRSGATSKKQMTLDLTQATGNATFPIRPEINATAILEFHDFVETLLSRRLEKSDSITLDRKIEKSKNELEKQIRIKTETLRKISLEPDWELIGNLFKIRISQENQTRMSGKYLELTNPETGEEIKVPIDPKLSPQSQLERFFKLAKKNKTAKKEAAASLDSLLQQKANLERILSSGHTEDLARKLDSLKPTTTEPHRSGFTCFDLNGGFEAFVGRNKKENLELTLRFANGNDLWMHVKGKPSAHLVLRSKEHKPPPLEILILSAQILIHFSKGKDWGKTEVDYTLAKNVKRIKGSDQVSYTQNKTLMVTPLPNGLPLTPR